MKEEQKQNFQLAQLNIKNLVELNGWEQKQKEIVEANPLIEVTSTETYEIAKERRTALRTARTTLQNQDKEIGSLVSKFRKQVKAETQRLINITAPHEENQQQEVKKWEEGIEQRRREREEKEEREKQENLNKVREVSQHLKSFADSLTFENSEQLTEEFEKAYAEAKDKVLDFGAYGAFLQDEMTEMCEYFYSTLKEVEEQERTRVENEKQQEEAILNRIKAAASATVYETPYKDKDKIVPALEKLFESTTITHNKDKFKELVSDFREKAKAQIQTLEVNEQQRIELQELRELKQKEAAKKSSREYLALFEKDWKKTIQGITSEESIEAAKATLDFLASKSSLENIDDERHEVAKRLTEQLEEAETRFYEAKKKQQEEQSKIIEQRKEQLKELGVKVPDDLLVIPEEDWEATIEDAQKREKERKENAVRQKKVASDKKKITKKLDEIITLQEVELPLRNAEMKSLWKKLEKEVDDYRETLKSMVEKA